MNYDMHRADRTADGLVFAADREHIRTELAALQSRLEAGWLHHIGFPGTSDIHHSLLAELLTRFLINNIGDPYEDGIVPTNTKTFERRVLDLAAELFRAPTGGWWGCITHGASEGTLHALRAARRRYPDAIVIHSAAAHYSVPKAADLLGLPTAVVVADEHGEMDYTDLHTTLATCRPRRPVIVATIGTTMTEAIDDLRRIVEVCDELGIEQRFIHADTALSGIPLALLDPLQRPGFDLADGADSIVTSGHKFLSTLMPSGILILKSSRTPDATGGAIDYIGGHDTTIPSSRNGHLALLLWEVLRRHGIDGLRRRADLARRLADYAQQTLTAAGWPAWRHPHAFTVVLRNPADDVRKRWSLPSSNGWSHIICMPGVTRYQIDVFIGEVTGSHQPGVTPLRSTLPLAL